VPDLDLDTVLSEQGSGRRILSDALHHRPGVVKNEQGRVRKLTEPSRVRVGTCNVWSLTGKLREVVDTMIRRHVNILCVQDDGNKSLYLVFVGLVFSQHLGLLLEQLVQQRLGLLLEQL
jgi:hypothetical protein